MTQDQDQRGPGYVVHGDAVPEDETREYTGDQDDQTKPMTRFQKVASALRGTGSERDEYDETGPDRDDYWDDSATARGTGEAAASPAGRDETVAAMDPDVPVDQTNPDVPMDETRPVGVDHPVTEPDMFGTTTHPVDGTGMVPPVAAAEGQPGAATIADVPADAVPAAETAGSTDQHAAAAQADRQLRPGEATVALGDFSDLTYGDLVPDAGQFAAQWQQIQFMFVDDPHASVSEAADIVAQVTAKMETAIQERQRAIAERQQAIAEQQRSLRDRWGEGNNADTENLRATLRMYKTFLDQLIGPKAS